MKIVKGIIWLVGITALATSCTKQPLPEFPNGEGVIYRISGNVDGEEKDIEVGLDDVVLTHGSAIWNEVPTYFGEVQMPNSDEKLRISFCQLEKWQKTADEKQIFDSYEVPLVVNQQGTFRFDFGAGNQDNFMEIQEDGGNFVYTKQKTFNEYGIYHMKARFDDLGTGTQTFDFDLRHGFQYQEFDPSYSVYTADSTLNLYANSTDASLSHEWYINYNLVCEEAQYTGFVGNGVHEILHIVRDSKGNSAKETGLVRFKGGKQFWTMNTFYVEDENVEESNFGNALLAYYKNGEWYRSQNSLSNIGSKISIDNVQYIPEINGYIPVISFDFSVEATLVNETKTDSLELTNFNGKFSVGL